ncbi:hypothetical protein B9J93_05090 [Vibrio sp. V17_P4S1T151]|uniref:hypothetical protein n=1 Tax=unclassified Vibrio TaxID=2614977 RepID=UPI000B8EA847|nr:MULTISPECIES: hypothetical protein [unclassified Vibrio]OXX48301.1 hypothetical protein B9J93_05090 [Vibrio sp. V17_P4S1T151]OXX64797.1 hypothetical protein B9J89_02695 [Vibrio sp. V15_P4S5T153]
MNRITHNKHSLLKEFLPSYLLGWALLAISIYAFSSISVTGYEHFGDFVWNVIIAFLAIGLLISAASVAMHGFSYLLGEKVTVNTNELMIELPTLTNFRVSSEFYISLQTKDLLVFEERYACPNFNKTMANIGFKCRLLDEHGKELPVTISCQRGENFVLLAYPNHRADIKKAKTLIMSSEKEFVADISFLNI